MVYIYVYVNSLPNMYSMLSFCQIQYIEMISISCFVQNFVRHRIRHTLNNSLYTSLFKLMFIYYCICQLHAHESKLIKLIDMKGGVPDVDLETELAQYDSSIFVTPYHESQLNNLIGERYGLKYYIHMIHKTIPVYWCLKY